MKKLIIISLLLMSINSFAQEDITKEKLHELKLNALNTLIFKSLDASYEYLINKESSAGISIMVNLNDLNTDGPYYNETFAITPYYRHFFSRKYASGFFMEGFGMYNVQEDHYYYDYNSDMIEGQSNANNKSNNFALGISLGAKFVSEKGFAFEFFAGIGRNLFTSDSDDNFEFVPRLGTSFGYRF
ncbi:MAG: DUF3575 domain-containing protein [Bacteroidota bacterium]